MGLKNVEGPGVLSTETTIDSVERTHPVLMLSDESDRTPISVSQIAQNGISRNLCTPSRKRSRWEYPSDKTIDHVTPRLQQPNGGLSSSGAHVFDRNFCHETLDLMI